MPDSPFTVLWRAEEESWNAFLRRIREAQGELMVILSSTDNTQLLQEEDRKHFLDECKKLRYRLRLATKEPVIVAHARREGMRVIDRTRKLRALLKDHSRSAEALRFFSPSLWRQQWRSRLQTIGLLSVPRVRIFILVLLSVGLFVFVVFRLLPSADVLVWPRSDLVTLTMNITLIDSGAVLPVNASHARMHPLEKIHVHIRKAITFNDISPEFTGTNAQVEMTIINQSTEAYSLRKGTRLLNQAGMIFRIQEAVLVDAGKQETVKAKAEDLDLYEKIIGQRGNVPAGLQWEFPGLTLAERKLILAKNLKAATGGSTSQRTVLLQKDVDIGMKRLKQELLVAAKQMIEEQRQLRSSQNPNVHLELLAKDDVIRATYSGFLLPTNLLGQPVTSVAIEGQLLYTVPAYNLQGIQEAYSKELQGHTGEGKRLIPDSVHIDPQKVIIIEFADDGSWIKITADVTGTEQFVLEPLTPMGAKFGTKVREAIAGLSVTDAQRILRNFPEVERVDISLWPPWNSTLPSIASNITISPQ